MLNILNGLMAALLILVGMINGNFLLLLLGGADLVYVLYNLWSRDKDERQETKAQKMKAKQVNDLKASQATLRLNDHIVFYSREPVKDIGELGVYYDDELAGFLADFKDDERFVATYHRLVSGLEELLTEKPVEEIQQTGERKARDFAVLFERRLRSLAVASVQDELEEIVDLLYEIDRLEQKYPQIKKQTARLYDQYLPILDGILEQAEDVADKNGDLSSLSDRMQNAVMATKEAIKILMSRFISGDMLNLSTDLTVLETVLRKDGLIGGGHDEG